MEEHNHSEGQSVDVEKHPKQDFQVERLAFFSDAVFAIVITLLVIEFKVPHITDNSTYQEVLKQLSDQKYHFIAILFSFLLIASYWSRHHFLFKYIHNYNKQIIVANMLVLLPIIFLPFTTAFFAESLISFFLGKNEIVVLGLNLFVLNHFLAASALYILYWLATNKNKGMSYDIPTKEKIGLVSNLWFMITFFGALFIATLFTSNPFIIFSVEFIVFPSVKIFQKIYKKRLTENK